MKDAFKRIKIKFGHWEYWNSTIIYIPLFPYLLYLIVRSRDFFFFIAANPGIENGGFTLESKWKIQEQMQHKHFPKTAIISRHQSITEIENELRSFQFPLYLKPDIGGKGRGVVQVHSMEAIRWYHQHCPLNYLVQEKVSYPNEIGVFFIKPPGQEQGYVSGIVAKEYIRLIGDGQKTIEELLRENPRYFLQLKRLKRENQEKLDRIPEKGQLETISEIGNHAQGSRFIDQSANITPRLTAVINDLARNLDGFNFGRFDIRFRSWEELEQGKNFAIIEVNGSGSEPTHIYDSGHSIFFAWSEIIRHWKAMSGISKAENEKTRTKISFFKGVALMLNHVKVMKQLDKFSGCIQHTQHGL